MEAFGTGQGFLKAGLLGFAKSGKTHTAMLLAVELRKRLALTTPVALFDTEASGEYIAGRVKAATGQDLVGMKSRAFVDLMKMARECEAGAAGILIVDSITHVWREVCDSYLEQVNKARDSQNKSRRTRLEFQDWAIIKAKWANWADYFLNSRLHIIICGRAGFEWDFEESENADGSTRKDLVKTGVKMKVESEFGFEPSLLVEMERVQVPDEKRNGRFKLVHRATVIGDRFDSMDGLSTDNPSGEWFAPHLALLTPGASNIVNTTSRTDLGVNEEGDAEFVRERRRRAILCEEIEGELVKAYPGQSKEEKKAKVMLVEAGFKTKSWLAVQAMPAEKLAAGLAIIRDILREADEKKAQPVAVAAAEGGESQC